jgi:hypothetical protein
MAAALPKAMSDLDRGRFREFDDVEDPLTELRSQPGTREELFAGDTVQTLYEKARAYQQEGSESEKKE